MWGNLGEGQKSVVSVCSAVNLGVDWGMIEGSNVGCRFVWGMLSRFELELDLIYDLQRASCKKDEGSFLLSGSLSWKAHYLLLLHAC